MIMRVIMGGTHCEGVKSSWHSRVQLREQWNSNKKNILLIAALWELGIFLGQQWNLDNRQ